MTNFSSIRISNASHELIGHLEFFTKTPKRTIQVKEGPIEWSLFHTPKIWLSRKAHLLLLQGLGLNNLFYSAYLKDEPYAHWLLGQVILSGGESFLPYDPSLKDVRIADVATLPSNPDSYKELLGGLYAGIRS